MVELRTSISSARQVVRLFRLKTRKRTSNTLEKRNESVSMALARPSVDVKAYETFMTFSLRDLPARSNLVCILATNLHGGASRSLNVAPGQKRIELKNLDQG